MTLFMVVTSDKYQLPVMICESRKELVNKLSLSYSCVQKHLRGEVNKHIIYKVEVDEE